MHTKPDLQVCLKWWIAHSGWVILYVIPLKKMRYQIRHVIIVVAVIAVMIAILERNIHKTIRLTVQDAYAVSENDFWFTLESTDASFTDAKYVSPPYVGGVFVARFGNSKLLRRYIDRENLASIAGTTIDIRFCNWSIMGYQKETWMERLEKNFPGVHFMIPGTPPQSK